MITSSIFRVFQAWDNFKKDELSFFDDGGTMPSVSGFKIYAPVEPCNYTGQKLIDTINKLVEERLNGRELNMMGCCIGPNGMLLLAQDPRLANIKRLNLGGNKIGDIGAKLLAESEALSKLTWLELGGNDIGPEGVEILAKTATFKKLKTLNLYRNYLKDQGAKILAEENSLTDLEEIDLALNEIGDAGLLAMAHSKKFPNLVSVCIDNNFTGREARETAKLAPNFKKVQSLIL